MSRKKMGRPSLGTNARTIIVPIRVSAVELAAVEARVARENAELLRDGAIGPDRHRTTVSSWFRDHGLDAVGLHPRESAD